MNWKGLGKKRSRTNPDGTTHTGICLEERRKTTNKVRIAGIPDEISSERLPNASLRALPLCDPFEMSPRLHPLGNSNFPPLVEG
jgi:hypothetical protein